MKSLSLLLAIALMLLWFVRCNAIDNQEAKKEPIKFPVATSRTCPTCGAVYSPQF